MIGKTHGVGNPWGNNGSGEPLQRSAARTDAAGGTRTHTPLAEQQILSLLCLPIPPQRRVLCGDYRGVVPILQTVTITGLLQSKIFGLTCISVAPEILMRRMQVARQVHAAVVL